MKTADLQGAALDYWVARAEGVTAERAMLPIAKGGAPICYVQPPGILSGIYRPSTDWAQGGPLLDKYAISVMPDCHLDAKDDQPGIWHAQNWKQAQDDADTWGEDALQAICRAVVRAAFGDEVEEVLP